MTDDEPLTANDAIIDAVVDQHRLFRGLRGTRLGIGAIGVKELRGRMRGRRAFVVLSLYLLLLGGFTWMVEVIMERTYSAGFGGSSAFATAAIGQGIFAALLMLETLLVVFLAPMSTVGAISLEREKQTLEMLTATPISSAAIVVGKLVSALVYVWLLIAASIPFTAVVFVFGGVAPEDLVRGYLVLVVTALGFGAFGLFCSSIVKRTQAATAITIFGVLALSIGTLFGIVFWQALATPTNAFQAGPVRGADLGPIAYLNPFLAQAEITPTDALCASDNSLRYYCLFRETFMANPSGIIFVNGSDANSGGVIVKGGVIVRGGGVGFPAGGVPGKGVGGGGVVVPLPAPIQDPSAAPVQFGATGTIWTKTVVAWLILSVLFLVLSIQFVSPTRRWHFRRGPSPVEGAS
ncbi:MAG: ABC transporter permease [Chloroflexota bacterium]|jgi:ABC-type transport system involved in multi-copper enzyme maturation permease subunit